MDECEAIVFVYRRRIYRESERGAWRGRVGVQKEVFGCRHHPYDRTIKSVQTGSMSGRSVKNR